MDDLISRQAAIDAIERNAYRHTYLDQIVDIIRDLQSAQPEANVHDFVKDADYISRQAAIDFIDAGRLGNPNEPRWSDNEVVNFLKSRPSAQPERLNDDDFETIRIHLNACKEKLCNQQRWKEANEYQRIIDRFMAFASAQPESLVNESRPLVKDLVKDTISRQVAIDALAKFVPYAICDASTESYTNGLTDAYNLICQLPSAQPDIIHCEDCKYWQDQEEGIVEVPICARPQNKYEKHPFIMIINGNGFCSYAKRRTDEQTISE